MKLVEKREQDMFIADREKWLNKRSYTENDVMQDENGCEYVIEEQDNGEYSDVGYRVIRTRLYLPDKLQRYEQ